MRLMRPALRSAITRFSPSRSRGSVKQSLRSHVQEVVWDLNGAAPVIVLAYGLLRDTVVSDLGRACAAGVGRFSS